MIGLVECGVHGPQQPAYVCAHLVQTLNDGAPRGVIWSFDDEGAVNAYCDECGDALEAGGGEWTDELEARAQVTLICRSCFDRILAVNGQMSLN